MKKANIALLMILFILYGSCISFAQMPFVYPVENTGAECKKPKLLPFDQLPVIDALPDPFSWVDGRGQITKKDDCYFAGKMALFAGAFDERIALTIAQETGGGGNTAWRVTEKLEGKRETLKNAQGAFWYREDFSQFNNAVTKLPYDHHELMAMVAPRALLVIGNTDYEWLADESGYVGCKAAQEVWKSLGVPDRFGYSIVGGHGHCQLPEIQKPEVIAFVEKFLLGNKAANTEVARSPYNTDLSQWITWKTPKLK